MAACAGWLALLLLPPLHAPPAAAAPRPARHGPSPPTPRAALASSVLPLAQALLANIAAMYAVYHGPQGLTQIADRVHGLAAVLAEGEPSRADLLACMLLDHALPACRCAARAAQEARGRLVLQATQGANAVERPGASAQPCLATALPHRDTQAPRSWGWAWARPPSLTP